MYNREKILKVMHEIADESKEISPYVVIAQPRRIKEEIPAQKLDGYHGLHIDVNGISHGFCNIYGESVDVARNYLIEQALESGAKYMFFVGEDTVIPYDGFRKLHETAEANPGAIITGVYYIKLSTAMIMVREGNWISIPNVDPGQLIEAWQTGMDAMLIPIDILRRMKEEEPEIPFCCIANNIDGIPFIGEDNFFVHRIHKMGVKLLVNTDVQCLHMDLATGKYTAHPSVDLKNYYTNIPITGPLTLEDKEFIDRRWLSRLPGERNKNIKTIINDLESVGKPVKFNMGYRRDRLEEYITVDEHNPVAEVKEDILTVELPLNCADEILASHVLERIYHIRVPELLQKWHSALKADGKLVLEMLDLESTCKEFVDSDASGKFLLTYNIYGAHADYINEENLAAGTANFHAWGYYPESIKKMLLDIGYSSVQILPAQMAHPGKNFRVEAAK